MDVLSGGHGRGGIIEALKAKVYGNGTETIVLSHGYGSDQSVWHFLIPYLACYFKVVVFDLVFAPTVNPSLYDPQKYSSFEGYAMDLVELLDEMKLNNTVYVGHSMSAMIGCVASIKRPELFRQLVLLCGSPRYLNAKGYTGGFERSQIDTIFKNIDQNFEKWVKIFAPAAVGVNDTTAVSEFESSLRAMNPKIALSVGRTIFLSDLRDVLAQVKVRSTIIQSSRDVIVPKSVAHYMKEKVGGKSRMKILKTRGHFPHLTAYRLLLDAMLKRVRVVM